MQKERVTSDFAFSYVGIDYAEPLFVKSLYCKEHDVMYKAWVVLVTCANSRSIYLDLVPDCTSKCCIDALKRFVNSRGTPKIVISGNGKYVISTDVQSFATSSDIHWKFNIESATWYGGFFERLVKSVKRCLKKQLGKAKIDYDEMITVLKEIENVINNRPISYAYFE